MGIKNSLVINLYGGPGAGKSTLAAGLFAKLKEDGVDCELVTEFVKEKIWENTTDILNDRFYTSAVQYHRVFRLNGKVDVIITESPIMLSVIYNDIIKFKEYDKLIYNLYSEFDNINFFIKRDTSSFSANGRIHNKEESVQKDTEIQNMLDKYKIETIYLERNNKSIAEIYTIIIKKLNSKKI
jgi:adenylylsulfate kinase-like enzyme